MLKLSRKATWLIAVIGLTVVILLISLFVKQYREKNYWLNTVAEHNYNHWSDIHFTAFQMENRGFTKETITDMYLFVNAKVYAATDDLRPVCSGDSQYTAFLQTYYVSLMQDITLVKDSQPQEAIDLFKEATIELKALAAKILDLAEKHEDRVRLVQTDSALYKEAQALITAYCNKYGQEISTLNLADE